MPTTATPTFAYLPTPQILSILYSSFNLAENSVKSARAKSLFLLLQSICDAFDAREAHAQSDEPRMSEHL